MKFNSLGRSMGVIWVCAAAACAAELTPLSLPTEPPLPDAASKARYVANLNDLGVGKYLDTLHPGAVTQESGWDTYYYDVTAGAACLRGTPYIVSARSGSSQDVVLYLQGGGACWDETTCGDDLPLAKKTADVPSADGNGIFAVTDSANPLHNWSMVFASYCDGSVFSGDNSTWYGGRQVWHWGIRNLSAAVTVMRQRYPNPKRILVTGSSAGGYGTLMGMGVVRAAFPQTPLWVLNDSGPGLENPALRTVMGEALRDNWKFKQFMPADCAPCEDQQIRLIDYALDRDPDLRVALFSYRYDFVIGSIFLGMFGDYPFALQEITDKIHERHPERFRRLFYEGLQHTILGSDAFYDPTSWGLSAAQWVRAFVDKKGQWQDFQ